MEKVRKSYARGFITIEGADFAVRAGELHGLLGESGAGKSTICKIITGVTSADSGSISFFGREIRPADPASAVRLGIVKLQKRSSLVPSLTVEENIVLGRGSAGLGALDRARIRSTVSSRLEQFGLAIPPEMLASELTREDAVETEIVKAVCGGVRLIILDEPSSYFSVAQTQELFALLRKVAGAGVSVLYVSDRPAEILELCDAVTVVSGGRTVCTVGTADETEADLRRRMMKNIPEPVLPKGAVRPGDTVLKVRGLSAFRTMNRPSLRNVSFSIRQGEILAAVGLPDSGTRELCEIIAGIAHAVSGRVQIYDDEITNDSVGKIRSLGVSFLISTPLRIGVAPSLSIRENLMAYQYSNPKYLRSGLLDRSALEKEADRLVREYGIECESADDDAAVLSTSSAQKLLAAREFSNDPVLLVAYLPSFGTGIGTSAAIARKLIELRDSGTAILLVPTDMDEYKALADSAIVFSRGSVSAYFREAPQGSEMDRYISGEEQMSAAQISEVCFD